MDCGTILYDRNALSFGNADNLWRQERRLSLRHVTQNLRHLVGADPTMEGAQGLILSVKICSFIQIIFELI